MVGRWLVGCVQVYDQILAMDDFLTFKKLMVRSRHHETIEGRVLEEQASLACGVRVID